MKWIYIIVLLLSLIPIIEGKVIYNVEINAGDSMNPALYKGDVVGVSLINRTEPLIENHIYCYVPNLAYITEGSIDPAHNYVCHRYLYDERWYRGYSDWENDIPFKVLYHFKGDNNLHEDPTVQRSSIRYEVVKLPKVNQNQT